MRLVLLLLAFAAALPGQVALPAPEPAAPPEFVQAVEFPYYLYPRTLWERELVWLKTVGIRTVEFSIPWNWHQVDGGACDFTGATSPRRDLLGFIRLLRRLEMRAWIRPLPPVKGWVNNGYPHGRTLAYCPRVLRVVTLRLLKPPPCGVVMGALRKTLVLRRESQELGSMPAELPRK